MSTATSPSRRAYRRSGIREVHQSRAPVPFGTGALGIFGGNYSGPPRPSTSATCAVPPTGRTNTGLAGVLRAFGLSGGGDRPLCGPATGRSLGPQLLSRHERVPGGCVECNAYRTARETVPGIIESVIIHENTC